VEENMAQTLTLFQDQSRDRPATSSDSKSASHVGGSGVPGPNPDGSGTRRSRRGESFPAHAAEIELLLLCARTELAPEQKARLQALLQQGLDWSYLQNTARMHGMLPLVYSHATAVDGGSGERPELAQLDYYFRVNASRALQLTGALLRILRLFGTEDIPAVPYKGPPLAARIYGSIALRQAGDLDILLRKQDIYRARALLLANGFRPRYPDTPGTLAFRMASRYSEDLVGPDNVQVELHWAFANRDVPFPLKLEDLLPRLETFSIGQSPLPAFRRDDLLLILSVHGAKHRWDRLEWIAGIAELLRSRDWDWDELIQRANEFGARRTLFLGLCLAHQLLDAPIPENVLAEIRSEPWINRLARDVHDRLFNAKNGVGGGDGGVLSRNLFQFPLQQSFRDQLRYLAYRLTTPNRPDRWRTVTVGERSLPIHALTWPLRLGAKLATMPFRYIFRKK
jgi:hypothetical protein